MNIEKATIDELVTLRADARMSAEAFTEAVKEQSEKAGISKGALRRYVCALEKGALDSLDAEASDLANLLETRA
jgi:hypothetical protein